MKVAVMGAGGGGVALASHLAQQGFQTALYAPPEHAKNAYAISEQQGEIHVTGDHPLTCKVDTVTLDIRQAIHGAEIIFMVVPAFGQEALFENMIPFLVDEQVIAVMPGNFATYPLQYMLEKVRPTLDITLIESSSLLHVAEIEEPGTVHIASQHKNLLEFSVYPEYQTQKAQTLLQKCMPETHIKIVNNYLAIGLNSPNGIVHPALTILNCGYIESTHGEFYFYKDGMTPAVCKIINALDKERQAIGKAYGLDLPALLDIIHHYYGINALSLRDFALTSAVHNQRYSAPTCYSHRYISEDVPYLLVPWLSLAKAANVNTPVLKSIISIASELVDCNFVKKGRLISHFLPSQPIVPLHLSSQQAV